MICVYCLALCYGKQDVKKEIFGLRYFVVFDLRSSLVNELTRFDEDEAESVVRCVCCLVLYYVKNSRE